MKLLNEKFKTILLFLLVLVLIIAGVLGISVYNSNKKVNVPDFANMSKSDVLTWCGQLNPQFSCEILYEDSDSVEVDKVISQSVLAGSKIQDKITFKISSGLKKEIELPVINSNTTLEEINNWITNNKIVNVTVINQNSDNVLKGNVIKVEPTSGINASTPITVYVSDGPSQEENKDDNKDSNTDNKTDNNTNKDTFYVNQGAYVGYTVSDFESKAKELGLNANHNTSRDAHSNNIEKGKVVWHGYGEYTKNETFNYGLSLGPSDYIVIPYNKYIDITVDEFNKIMNELKLNPTHDSDEDRYSDAIAKGKIAWHGNADNYTEGESIRYGLSLGKDNSSESGSSSGDSNYIVVNAGAYVGYTVSQFEDKAKELGLTANHDKSRDAYSNTIDAGKVVTHGYGDDYVKGEKFNYGVSLGKSSSEQPSSDTIALGSFADIESQCREPGNFDKASENVKNLLDSAGFTNYVIAGASARDVGVGVLMSISVNGNNHIERAEYPKNASIVVTICNSSEAS
jgi:beta-lactam-binding protein with PASTA domain